MNLVKVSIVGGAVILLLLTVVPLFTRELAGVAQVLSSQQQILYTQCIQTFSDKPQEAFNITSVDLNGDHRQDALVQYTTGSECGNAGCVYELCIADQFSVIQHIPFGYAAKNLTLTETKTNNMYDLILNDEKELKMIWNGTRYTLDE